MMDENFSDSLRNASSVEDFLSIIDKADAEQAGIDERLAVDSGEEAADTNGENAAQAGGQEIQAQKAGAETEQTAGPKILAVTSCPTGIAHTYMAAEGLERAARAKGWKIKVETRGSAGAKNVLTAQEIEAADCIIVAADAQVPMDRFDGKRVIECQVSDGISKAPGFWAARRPGRYRFTTQHHLETAARQRQPLAANRAVSDSRFTHS